jgi:hypothetical protein
MGAYWGQLGVEAEQMTICRFGQRSRGSEAGRATARISGNDMLHHIIPILRLYFARLRSARQLDRTSSSSQLVRDEVGEMSEVQAGDVGKPRSAAVAVGDSRNNKRARA